jgi:hypothetical protein
MKRNHQRASGTSAPFTLTHAHQNRGIAEGGEGVAVASGGRVQGTGKIDIVNLKKMADAFNKY